MKRITAIQALLLSVMALGCMVIASSAAAKDEHLSRWKCFWVDGRMTVGNGTPAVRIWPKGSHRLLGVVNPNPKMDYDAGDMLPENLKILMTSSNNYTVWGDFHVCPIVPNRSGWMRFVTIDRAHKLFVRP